MIPFTDAQLDIVLRGARDLAPEKRSVYLERIGALLAQRAGKFADADVVTAMEISLRSLMQHESAA